MEVIVLSKREFDSLMLENGVNDNNVEKIDPTCFISITDTDKSVSGRYHFFKNNHPNVLNLDFDDVEKDGESSPTQLYNTKAFSEEMASELIDFINKNKHKTQFIVHCMAGISRSGAIGTFINTIQDGDHEAFKRANRRILPNPMVYKTLINMYRNKFYS